MGLPVMQVSVCEGGWGYGSTCNAGVCMCRWMGYDLPVMQVSVCVGGWVMIYL